VVAVWSAACIEDDLSDSYAARKIALGMCADPAKDIVAGLTGNSEWRGWMCTTISANPFSGSGSFVCPCAGAAEACGDRRHPDKNFTLW
jgi:hypothetical protein